MEILLGADPEVFIRRGGKFASAYGMIPGTKEDPHPVEGGAVQVDGMSLEFNISPANTEQGFVNSITSVMALLRGMVPDYDVVIEPIAEFDASVMEVQPPEATDLGCDTDYNAWSGHQNSVPHADGLFRTGAGHVHIGWTDGQDPFCEEHNMMARSLVRELDYFLGLPSIIYDKCHTRRELYGQAGAYRPKPYGVEYRVLSNKWLTSESLMSFVYKGANCAIERLMSGDPVHQKCGDIQGVINTGDHKKAMEICEREGIEVAYAV